MHNLPNIRSLGGDRSTCQTSEVQSDERLYIRDRVGSVYIRDMVYRGRGGVFDFDRVVGKWNQNAERVGSSSTDVTDHLPEQPLSSTSSQRR